LTILQAVDDTYEPLLAMGFEVLQAFEEITNSPESLSRAVSEFVPNGRR
jgi:beta-N-acetylhexosaminidase